MLPYKYLNVTPLPQFFFNYTKLSSFIPDVYSVQNFYPKTDFFFIDINPLYFLETLRTCLSSGALDTIALIYNRHDSPCNVCYGKTSSRSVVKDGTVRKSGRVGGMFPGNKDFSNSRKVAINYSRVPQAPDVMNLGRRFCRQKVLQVEGIYFHYQKKLLSQVLVPVTYTSRKSLQHVDTFEIVEGDKMSCM